MPPGWCPLQASCYRMSCSSCYLHSFSSQSLFILSCTTARVWWVRVHCSIGLKAFYDAEYRRVMYNISQKNNKMLWMLLGVFMKIRPCCVSAPPVQESQPMDEEDDICCWWWWWGYWRVLWASYSTQSDTGSFCHEYCIDESLWLQYAELHIRKQQERVRWANKFRRVIKLQSNQWDFLIIIIYWFLNVIRLVDIICLLIYSRSGLM